MKNPAERRPSLSPGLEAELPGLRWTITNEPLTAVAHGLWRNCIQSGDTVIDATAGNGHDTLALAKLGAKVWAIDIQARALMATRERLARAGRAGAVHVCQADHSQLKELAGREALPELRLVVFNLGYLPGADHEVTTRVDSTRAALTQASGLLAPGGYLSVLVYPGHPEGAREWEMIASCAEALWKSGPEDWSLEGFRAPPERLRAPRLLWLKHSGVSRMSHEEGHR